MLRECKLPGVYFGRTSSGPPGRLKSSWCSANCPDGTNAEGYNYTYDEYGNRWGQTLASGSGPGPQPSYSFDNNNHLTPTNCTSGAGNFCYDIAGNLKYDGVGGNWAPDAEGRIFALDTSSASDTYTHDALGQRLERTVNSLTYDYAFDNQGHENTKGAVGFASFHWTELYLGGTHVNTYTNGSTYFSHADHLGSERMETDPAGNTNASAQTNLPFGEWTSSGMQSELGFTGDLLDNLDGDTFHTPNRQYSQTQGRWLIPDPAGLAAVNPWNPQTWNRYAYVLNNPVSLKDPSGLVDQECDQDADGNMHCSVSGGGDDPPPAGASPVGGAGGTSCSAAGICAGSGPPILPPNLPSLPNAPGFTLSVRAPGQSFGNCMQQNAKNYSAAGIADLATGANGKIANSTVGQVVGGNGVTGLISAFSGNGEDAAIAAGTEAPGLVNDGMGTTLTYGRRTTSIMSLNIAGVPGGPPSALAPASSDASSFLGSLSKAFTLGLDETTKLAVDVGLTGAEVIGCAIPNGGGG
jgi:RHS repeat-associated protein